MLNTMLSDNGPPVMGFGRRSPFSSWWWCGAMNIAAVFFVIAVEAHDAAAITFNKKASDDPFGKRLAGRVGLAVVVGGRVGWLALELRQGVAGKVGI